MKKAVKQESLPFPPTPSGQHRRPHDAGIGLQAARLTPRRLPADAPNILIVLIDDAGPGLPSTFGGEVETPTMDRIVKEGIALQPLPHHGHVLAHTGVPADRAAIIIGSARADRGAGE